MQKNDAQIERLALLSEELGEASQIIGKILRHGMDSNFHDVNNRALLEKELGDIMAAMCLLSYNKDINLTNVESATIEKMIKYKNGEAYLHYQIFEDDWPKSF